MMDLVPVDHDPFSAGPDQGGGGAQFDTPPASDAPLRITVSPARSKGGPELVPVDHDPFATDWGAYAKDIGLAIPSGLAKGAAAMVGLPGDVASGVDWLLGQADRKIRGESPEEFAARDSSRRAKLAESPPPNLLPSTQQVRGAIEDATGPLYEPQTGAGRAVGTISEFVPGALTGGSGVLRNLTNLAVIPGLTSELAGHYTKGTAVEPYARGAAALLSGGVASMINRPGAVSQTIQRNLPEGVTGQHVDQAHRLILEAGRHGIGLTWPEALSHATGQPVLTDAMRILESAPQSRATMQNFMGQRPAQVETAARRQFDRFTPATADPSAIGPAASRAAQSEIDSVRRRINDTAAPFYDAARTVRLTPEEMDRVRRIPGYPEARDAVRNDPQLNRYVSGLPEDSIGFLNEVKKQLDQQHQNAASRFQPGRNQQRAAGYSQDAQTVRNELVNADFGNPARNYETALNIERQGRQQFLQPLLDGPIGRVAKSPDTKKAIDVLFPENPIPHSENEIANAVAAISRHSRPAARQLVRAHIEMNFNAATKSLQSGPNQWGGAKFYATLVGNRQQAQNLRAAVEALPGGRGTWAGFEPFLDVLAAMGARQGIGSKTAFNIPELKALGSGSAAEETAKLVGSPGKWMTFANDKMSQWQLGRNLGELAAVLTDPNAAQLLRRIASLPPRSREAQISALRVIAMTNTARQGGAHDAK